MNRPPESYRAYAIAVGGVLAAVILRRFVFDNELGQQFPWLFFFLVVVVAASVGGFKPGVLATLGGAVCGLLLFEYRRPGDTLEHGLLRLTAFVSFGMLTSLWAERIRGQQRWLADEIKNRKKAEAALREREERIRMAVESADIGTWDLNVLTGERRWSDRAKAIFGLDPNVDPTKLSLKELLHPDDQLRTSRAIEAALDPRGKGRYEVEYRTVWADGTVRWVVAKGQAFFEGVESQRRAVRFLGTVLDITERKEAEKLLQEADRRKNEFLVMLAHELRNPLAPISYALQLWEAMPLDAARADELRGMLERQVQHLIRLIDDLMDVSRITSGKIGLKNQRIDLATVLAAAVESTQPIVAGRGHRLSVALPGEPVFVDGDADRLKQVFGNVLNNAAKFTAPGGEISICAEQAGSSAIVCVRDNGRGIPREMLSEIFEAFRQVDASLERSQGGLGIGLTLVKRLTEMHGGNVSVTSAGPGQGSEFVITLPAVERPAERVVGKPHFALAAERLPRRRILVADDLPEVAESLQALLEVMGQEVLVAHDGRAAVELAIAERPTVAFVDIAMPGMNGYEVARAMRGRAELSDVTLVALTGYGQNEHAEATGERLFDHHLTKPVRMETLCDLLRGVEKTAAGDPAA